MIGLGVRRDIKIDIAAVKQSLRNECDNCGINYEEGDTNKDLCVKINAYVSL